MSIAPSMMTIWAGTPSEGTRYTVQQQRTMIAERPTWTRFDDHIVKLTYPAETAWGQPTVIKIVCPILAWSKDRKRVLVVAPAGDKIWRDAKPCGAE